MAAESLRKDAKKADLSLRPNTFRVNGDNFYLTTSTLPSGGLKIAYNVPKKVVKYATKRNLIKRRIKAVLTPWRVKMKGMVVVGIKKPVHLLPFSEFKAELESLLIKLKF